MKCNHEGLALLEMVDGRKYWICRCGRILDTLPDLPREQVIAFMRGLDALTESIRAGAARSAEGL